MAGSLTEGIPDTGMAYNYDLGNIPKGRAGRNVLAAIKEAREQRTAADREARQEQNDRLKEMHENFRDAMTQQTERLRAATEAFHFNSEMSKQQRQEKELNDGAAFHRFYGMIKSDDPNRKAQIAELYNMFPGAIKFSDIAKRIEDDNKSLTVKSGLTKEEQQFLKEHGPSTFGGKDNNYKALQTAAGDTGAANHEDAAIAYGRVHDLMKKSVGLPTGTPEGISRGDYIKNIESTFQKPPVGTPPPSTPAPQNAAAWSNADLSQQTAPLSTPATTAPTATPTSQGAREFLQSMGFKKTSDSGAASSAATERSGLSDMLNESPETGYLSNKPVPSPTPKPTPQGTQEQFYTA